MRPSKQFHPQETVETPKTLICHECQVGHLKRKYLTYFTWMGEELITVPDFPAWVCDVCGYREYDLKALQRLNVILNPRLGQKNSDFTGTARRKGTDHLTPPIPGLE